MFKKKQKKEEQEPQETEPIESNTEKEQKEEKLPKETEETLKAFIENYDGIFIPESFNGIRPEATILNVLFAIYSELRKLNKDLIEEENVAERNN